MAIFLPLFSAAQTRTITGKVVYDSDFAGVPEVKVQDRNAVVLGGTNKDGVFQITIPTDTEELLLTTISLEPTRIKVPPGCNKLEVIMLVDVIHDYISERKIKKKRYHAFKERLRKHQMVHDKGIFTSGVPCFEYIFEE